LPGIRVHVHLEFHSEEAKTLDEIRLWPNRPEVDHQNTRLSSDELRRWKPSSLLCEAVHIPGDPVHKGRQGPTSQTERPWYEEDEEAGRLNQYAPVHVDAGTMFNPWQEEEPEPVARDDGLDRSAVHD
jgi:hypothetical protein